MSDLFEKISNTKPGDKLKLKDKMSCTCETCTKYEGKTIIIDETFESRKYGDTFSFKDFDGRNVNLHICDIEKLIWKNLLKENLFEI